MNGPQYQQRSNNELAVIRWHEMVANGFCPSCGARSCPTRATPAGPCPGPNEGTLSEFDRWKART